MKSILDKIRLEILPRIERFFENRYMAYEIKVKEYRDKTPRSYTNLR
ncbi:MAG TPA: hypothetical protein VMC80_01030 [Patescibacteria group bacterium]|nr:hypothetical protein [Patescibacteria group bacterium]